MDTAGLLLAMFVAGFGVPFWWWLKGKASDRDVPPHVKRLDDYRNPWGDE